MKNYTAPVLTFALLWLAVRTLAQQGPFIPQRQPVSSDAIKDVLGLTERQFSELTTLRETHQQKLQDISTQMRDLEQQRRVAMQAADNPVQVGSLALQIQSLQQQIEEENKLYHENALRVLDGGQRETVAKIEEALKLAPKAPALAQYGLLQGMGGSARGFLGNPGGPGMMMMRGGPMSRPGESRPTQ